MTASATVCTTTTKQIEFSIKLDRQASPGISATVRRMPVLRDPLGSARVKPGALT